MDTLKYHLTINAKDQILLPSDVVAHFGKEIYILKNFNRSLGLLTKQEFEEYKNRIQKQKDNSFYLELLYRSLKICDIEKRRINIPKTLKHHLAPENETELILMVDGGGCYIESILH